MHQDQHQTMASDSTSESARKRVKVTRACDACKSRKKRCSGEQPCAYCWKSGSECLYHSLYTRGRPQDPPRRDTYGVGSAMETASASSASSQPAQLGNLEIGQMAALDTHTAISSSSTGLMRVGGGREVAGTQAHMHASTRSSRRGSPDEGIATNFSGQYLGPTSAHSFLQGAWKRLVQEHAEAYSQHDDLGPSHSGDVPSTKADLGPPDRQRAQEWLTRYFEYAQPTYRFLHRPTTGKLLDQFYSDISQLTMARRAVVYMIFAISAIWTIDPSGKDTFDNESDGLRESDKHYVAAQAALATEGGPPTLESVQARMMGVLYLLNSSRPNQAWFLFGTTIQLALHLGLHRKRFVTSAKTDFITQECRKRLIWNCYTLDTYLSVMFGRPRLLHYEDMDQELPQQVNDEDMTAEGIKDRIGRRDCLLKAPVLHAKLSRIVSKASREQYGIQRISDAERQEIAIERNREIAAWQAELPPFLSGAIQASSLIPVLWRQMTVLRLAHSHAVMLVNRPFLLYKSGQETVYPLVRECLLAAKEVIDVVIDFVEEGQLFPFWYTQYITFNALTIVYVYIIQRRRGRVSPVEGCLEEDLFKLADTTQQHLAKATESNSPKLRFSIILDELRQTTQEIIQHSEQIEEGVDHSLDALDPMGFSPFGFDMEFPLMDFWPQLDSLPLSQLA